MKKLLKQKSKTDLVQSAVIGVLVLIIILMNLPLVSQFLGRLNPLGPYEIRIRAYEERLQEEDNRLRAQEQKNIALEFDCVRLTDANNILLALQDYYFDLEAFPETLGALREEGYIDSLVRLEDPESKEPYFYRRLNGRFVLCIRMSDMVKGVNTQYCDDQGKPIPSESPAESSRGHLKISNAVPVVNIREQPGVSSRILYKAKAGEAFVYVEEREGWYKVVLDGTHGWVSAEFVTVDQP